MATYLLRLPDAWATRMREVRPDDVVKNIEDVEQIVDETDALVLNAEGVDAVSVVQRIHRAHPEVPVLVLAKPGRAEEVSRALILTPFITDAATCLAWHDDEDAFAAVEDWLAAAARRRAHRQTITTMNEALASFAAAQATPSRYLGQLLEQAPAGVLMLDEKGVVMSANRRATALLGATDGDVVGSSVGSLFRDDPSSTSLVQAALAETVGPIRLVLGTGDEEKVLEASAGPVVGREGEPAVMLLLSDITHVVETERERDRSEELLRYQASLLTAQSEASFEGILVVDVDGKIVSFNSRFAEMWGIPHEVLRTRSDDAALQAVMNKLVDQEAFLARVRYLYEHPDETSVDQIPLRNGGMFERYSAPVRGAEGRHYGRVWFFHDISEGTRRERQLRFLADAGQIFAESLDGRDMLTRLASLFVRDIADRCVVYLVRPDGQFEPAASAHRPGSSQNVSVDRATVARVVSGPGSGAEASIASIDSATAICVPILGSGGPMGAVVIESDGPRVYDHHDRLLVENVAGRAALALQNAMLFEQRTHVARVLQQSLLPPALPSVRGLDLASAYSPAGEAYDVGGDFYDIFYVGDGRWAAIIGDVMGKGPEAASLTSLARYAVKAAGLQLHEPRAVLHLLNQAIFQERGGETFCTATYAVFEPNDRGFVVRLARGGHPPALVLRKDGFVDVFEPDGSLLGLFAEAIVVETTFELEHGDALILFTDGVTEARGVEDRFGFDRLKRFVATLRGRIASDVASAIEREVRGFEARGANDDVAILVMRASHIPSPGSGDSSSPRRLSLTPEPASASRARVFVRSVAADWGLERLSDDLVLLTDELVTNGIKHAETQMELVMRLLPDRIRVEVIDQNARLPVAGTVDPAATSGRGLFLVQTIAERWGSEASGSGKVVWFEMEFSHELTHA